MLSGAILGSLLGSILLDVPSVLLQGASDVDQPAFSPFVSAAIAFVSTLVVGGLAIAFVPDYVDRIVDRINENPLATFGWGFLIYVASIVVLVIVVIVLFITIIGILLLFPLALLVIIVGAAANAFGFIAIFGRIVDSQGQALVLGAAAAGILSLIPVIGTVAGFVASTLGIGAMFKDLIE